MPTKIIPTETLKHLAETEKNYRRRAAYATALVKRYEAVGRAPFRKADDSTLRKGNHIAMLSAWLEKAKATEDGKYLIETFGENPAEEALIRWYVDHQENFSPVGDKAYRQLKRSGGFGL